MRIVDLFAGCGGMSRGFENAGYDVVAAFELWETAAECYEQNFDHPIFRQDLSEPCEAEKIIRTYAPEMIIGGPPCQDFSHAGKRIEAGRASLTGSYAEIIKVIRPKYFVMENVDRAQKSNAYAYARQTFKETGYGLTEIVLDASKCGVPQKRKRFFCIGVLNAPDDCVKPFIECKMSEKETTLRDYFGNTLDFEFYYRHPRNYSRRGIFSIDEPAPTMRGVNRPVPKGYPGHPNDACPLNDSIRALTTLERALIQTFPADFKWKGNKTDTEQMIGNAVPVKLAEFVANSVSDYIRSTVNVEKNEQVFQRWLLSEKKISTRSASDVLSRLKRANRIVAIGSVPDERYVFELERQSAFDALVASVKSQIRRAAALYTEFCGISR